MNPCIYVLWTVHLSIILGNDQLDTQMIYFTVRLLWSCTCFEHHQQVELYWCSIWYRHSQ